jgi:hypothetical protein
MSIQDSTAGSREIPTRAGADAWLDGNRQLVEANEFFALAIEPDAIVKGAPGRKERPWVPSIWARRDSGRAVRV